ncbi:MAG: BTAD domain-containing putative transcriptional regulator, partial [Actinoplanes sp.]
MDFRILGRLEVVDDGQPVAFRGGKPATLLGVLLLESGRVVPASRLIDELWGEEPPASAAKLVQGYVHALRQSLGAGLIVTRQPGYLADTGRVDAARFERLAQEGQALLPTAPARAAERFREALGLWRGDALEGLVFRGAAAHRRDHLAERRLAVQEQRIDADLALGRHAALVTELRQLVAAHPYRERLCGQLMLALYRTRRQADALQAYRDTRRLLADELGLEPGPELRRLEQRILAHDPELELAPEEPETPAPTAATGHRLVTVVAAGVAAETDDAELAHRLFRQHTRLCAEVFGRHAGAVQSGDGGTVVGVFGLVELHEDDALRALRAADELRRRQGAVHIGVESGEVFVGTDARQAPYAVGAAVDRAVRLREAAAAGEVVLGSGTHRLAGPSLGAEDRDGAWLFRDIGAPVRPDTPLFVGRDRELDTLRAELTRAVRDRSCRLVTVVGDPGIGKSRLVRRFLHGLGDRVTAVTGTCLPYGEGITFHPVAEIVGQLTGGDPPARLDGLLRGVDRADVIARWVLGAIGPSAEAARTEETFWAVRRLAEHTAGVRPLVMVVEDLHLAEPTLLDLVDYLATFAGGAPILLLCTARPDLLETSPGWAVTRTLLNLDPLDTTESRRLADTMGDSLAERERAVLAAQGNPLFLEQLLAAGPSPGDRLPPTIQAVLAARLDRLEPAERLVLTHGSVEGQRFHRALLADLLDGAGDGDGHGAALRSLVRKRFLRAEAAPGGGDDAFRFAHVLIRDVAYCSLPKEVRAGLHERLGRQLAAVPDTADELIGHHLERAYRMRSDLHLDAASGPALLRGDVPAAARLLERAAAMLGTDDPERAAVLPRLGTAL